MKDVLIFEDGKICRGYKAKLIKRGKKRILIEFKDWDDNLGKEILVREWFKIYIPSYLRNKKNNKHNNKRKSASYCHSRTNLFYTDKYQTREFKEKMMEDFKDSEYKKFFE